FACCCTGPGGPARGRRSAMGGGMAMGLRTLGLLMGEVKARTMIDRSWPPGSADVPVGSHFEWVADGDVGAPRFYAAHDVGPRVGGPVVARPSRSGRQQVKQGRSSCTIQPPRCSASP